MRPKVSAFKVSAFMKANYIKKGDSLMFIKIGDKEFFVRKI